MGPFNIFTVGLGNMDCQYRGRQNTGGMAKARQLKLFVVVYLFHTKFPLVQIFWETNNMYFSKVRLKKNVI